MSILSITFHTPDNRLTDWQLYKKNELHLLIENLMEVEKYILSTVESDLINEGENTNLLLFFDNDEKRQDFIEIELLNISDRIEQKFGKDIMIFQTLLNPEKSRG